MRKKIKKNLEKEKKLLLIEKLRELSISKIFSVKTFQNAFFYWKKDILQINPNINIHVGIYQPLNLHEFDKNDNYLVFSGIGNHETFISMIKEYGLDIAKDIEFPDHYEYTSRDIEQIIDQANVLKSKIITTEKDYLRLENYKPKEIKFIKSTLKIIDEKKLINTIIKSNETN